MRTTKFILLFLSLITLVISPMQLFYQIFREAPLKGFYRQSPPETLKYFTWSRWFSSEFQEVFSTRLNDNIGLRKSLIRVNNQYDFSLFGMTHAKGFIRGKKDYLFEEDYIHEYNGDYFIGKPAIAKKLSRLKNVMDSLNAHHVPLLLVYEPGKASFYPEFIPGRFLPEKKVQTNYDYYLQYSRKLGLAFLDLNNYYLKMKDTSRFPLFPRYGMHWSVYGTHVVADTLSGYVAKAKGLTMPVFKVHQIHHSARSLGSDYDIGELFNLLSPLKSTPGAYPMVSFNTIPAGTLSALVVADSYYITLTDTYGKKMFGKQDFWYYNNRVYPYQNWEPPIYADKSNLREKLLKYDVILLMTSEINLHCGFWNFADEAFLAFHPEIKDALVYGIENEIRNDREWFRFVVDKARFQHKPVEEMVRDDADYTFNTNYKELKGKSYLDSIYHLTFDIKNNAEWLARVKKKAQEQNIGLDSMIMRDAIYSYYQFKKKH